jgi:two-component system, OmpR family, sensor kinase
MIKPRSIRTRLTLWYTGLLTLTLLLLGSVTYGLMVNSLSRDIDTALQNIARVLSQQARREAAAFYPSAIDEIFRRFFGVSPLDRYVEMLDPRGQRDPRLQRPSTRSLPLSPAARANAGRGLPTWETIDGLGDYPVRLFTQPVMQSGRLINLIQVGFSLQSFHETRRHFLHIMALMFPIALLLAGGGGWLLAHRALAPVAQMAQAAQRIGAAHLNERLNESGTDDELDQLARTLNAMLSRLDDAFRQIRQFSADASHELQTPLTILKGELEVALRAPRSADAYQQTMRSALEEIDRMAVLVDGLMLLARADAGVLRMDQQPVELDQLVQEIYEQTQILAAHKHVHLQLGPMEPITIQGDPERLRRLLLNLTHNAIKYTPSSGRVTLALQRCHDRAALRVSDTGIGLTPQEQKRVFQRFYRSDSARLHDAEGAGLGLCIARSIADAHGGTMELDSTPGAGSTFTVLLPLL